MAKDPAFLFYPGDFNDGTQDFTNEEVGAYIRLLLFQFSQGHLSIDRIKRKLGRDFEALWPMLAGKFILDNEGLYFNQRLETEQFKRKAFSESRRKNINTRYEKEVNNISATYVEHMENENRNRNKDEIKKEVKPKFQKPEIPEIVGYLIAKHPEASTVNIQALSEKFWNHYENKDWKAGKNKMKDWRLAFTQWDETIQKMLYPHKTPEPQRINLSGVNFGNKPKESVFDHNNRVRKELYEKYGVNQQPSTEDIGFTEVPNS
jgi:hypothetical protein